MPRKTKITPETLSMKLLEPLKGVNCKHNFECPYCKSIFITTPTKVDSGHTKSCGCVAIGRRTGSEYFSGDFLSRCKRGAKARNIKWQLSNNDLDIIIKTQNFRCNLTNEILIYGYIPLNEYTASIDRIDSSKNYTKNNVQILHKNVNLAKQSLTQLEFITLCKKVAICNQ
jgi:hypothetical protein